MRRFHDVSTERSSAALTLLACCLLNAPVVTQGAEQPGPPLMLANAYRPAQVDPADYWISEKYDGIRAYWDGRQLLTRNGNRIVTPDWFVAGWPQRPLDGELWMGRGQFPAVSATVRDSQPDPAAWRQVRFMVFDLPAQSGDFTQRLNTLIELVASLQASWLQAVPQFRVADHPALLAKLDEVIAGGGEGLMLHRDVSAYRAVRSDDLLKLKSLQDAEARVIGHLPGKGKYVGMMGALELQWPQGPAFRVGTGFTDEQRRHPPPIGSWVTFSYNGVTENGVPRFARFVRVRSESPGTEF